MAGVSRWSSEAQGGYPDDARVDPRIQAPERPVRLLRWWHELVLATLLYACYDAARGLSRGGFVKAERDGWHILDFERALHLDPEGWLNAHLQTFPLLAVPACYAYATLHFVVTPSVLVWAYCRRPTAYARARTTLALATAGALFGFWFFPTAPPRLLIGGGFQDTLATYSNWGWWGSQTSIPQGAAALANQFAAMPSLHVAWSIWCAATLIAHVRSRTVRVLAGLYPVITATVVLATANHYLLDVAAGAALWALAHAFVRVYPSRLNGGTGVTWT
ncbi:MAG: phosphatase PAP2 family protein [Nocardioides sp.]